MASIQQNKSIQCFISRNFKPLLFVVVFLTLLFVGSKMFGASPFTDYFDDYTGVDLNDNSDWEDCQSYFSFQISSTTNYSEPNSAFGQETVWGKCSEKTGNQIGIGSLSFWAKISGGTSPSTSVFLTGATSTARWMFYPNGDTGYYDGQFYNVCSVDNDTWFWLILEWNNITDKVRYTCESIGQTSGWVDAIYETDIDYFDKVRMLATGNNPNSYFDDFGGMTSCQFYEVYETCVAGGCSWYYSIYLQEYFCVDPISPDPEECGAFYKCQYCETLTTCEQQFNCEWIDKGYGNQCYLEEPTIPPDQADWEIPDLDDCSGLPALDTIVCEIKNLISGVFMPSQEKVEVLYQTIGVFKEKFPFNYVASFNTFFSDIAVSLEETTTIPIEILGATSTVNFTFWNTTTTIGGEVETLNNVLFDFTTFIFLMGWFVWFISLIKRFF